MKPIIKWSGGKKDEIKHFEKYIPEFDTYLEPFFGGGSVFFHLKPKKSAISDVHSELIDFYTTIKNKQGSEIYDWMKNQTNEEKHYYKVRDEMKIDTSFKNACRFYYLRKTCYRGMLRYNSKNKFNIPFGKYKTFTFEEVKNKKYEKLFQNCDVYLKDFSYLFENYNDENNFMFLDPPYDCTFTDYGYCKFDQEDHKRLANYFKTTKIKCLMVIGKTEFISELYKDYIVDEYDKKYKFRIHSGRVNEKINTKHLIIKNY